MKEKEVLKIFLIFSLVIVAQASELSGAAAITSLNEAISVASAEEVISEENENIAHCAQIASAALNNGSYSALENFALAVAAGACVSPHNGLKQSDECECVTKEEPDGRCSIDCYCENTHGKAWRCSDIRDDLNYCPDRGTYPPSDPDYNPSYESIRCEWDYSEGTSKCYDENNNEICRGLPPA